MPLPSLISFQNGFLSGKPPKNEYLHFSELNCNDLDAWIVRICRTVSLEYLHEILFTILNELLVNECKANAKRVFFKKQGLDIFSYQAYPHFLEFRVPNNAKLHAEEKNRIDSKTTSSVRYKYNGEAYKESVDNEESSDLGIVLIHILLRNSGVKNYFFELHRAEFEEILH